ncbi:hypothetical protein MIB92_09095 [Aestuariirhabdus sp. Z084]|uniref:hypothetical protein n=1 Tax=Aestuariirhabdus haliotis TaxID=2918751 RepID=UPI0020BDDB9A|nr:hypothetical protein [Aestuariirhabdus haliotis]MCL6415807.1 hypothetical protein [Aestuariirhabdus haliotis]
MQVGIVKGDRAFLPEAEAYADFLDSNGISVKVYRCFQLADKECQVVICFMGFLPFWVRKSSRLIVEYHSLSVGKMGRLKDVLKRLLNVRGDYRFFLNSTVREKLWFSEENCTYRPMGYVQKYVDEYRNEKKIFDFVYSGKLNRVGVVDAIAFISRLGFSVAVVGDSESEVYPEWKDLCIKRFGIIELSESYRVMASAKYGLNFMPDEFPLNVQDSTKLIEYCALGLRVVTTRYKWVDTFEHKYAARFLDYNTLSSKESVEEFPFKSGDVSQLSWDVILSDSKLDMLVKQLLV